MSRPGQPGQQVLHPGGFRTQVGEVGRPVGRRRGRRQRPERTQRQFLTHTLIRVHSGEDGQESVGPAEQARQRLRGGSAASGLHLPDDGQQLRLGYERLASRQQEGERRRVGRRQGEAVADEDRGQSPVSGETKGRTVVADDQRGPHLVDQRLPVLDGRRQFLDGGEAADGEDVGVADGQEGRGGGPRPNRRLVYRERGVAQFRRSTPQRP